MKRLGVRLSPFLLAVLILCAPGGAAAKPVTETDSYADPGYDLSKVRSVCPWPVSIKEAPEIVSLSMPVKANRWVAEAIESNRGRRSFIVKSADDVWRDVWFIRGPFDFGDPFENEETERVFYSNLGGACGAVLRASLSLKSERKWQEPRTEYYWTTVSASSMRPRRRRDGGIVWVEIERDIPVRRERVIPGYWYTVASARCDAELYDADNTQKYVAASKSFGDDSGAEGEKQMIERLAKKTIGDAVAAIFNAK